jgi:tetratricopeptide (TPR) repeat protein
MDYINTKLDLAFKLKEIGDYTGAEEELIEGLNIASDNNLLLTSLADLYSRQDRLDEAFSIADQVLSREINNQRALIIKGDISLKRRKYRDAIDYFRNAIRSGENSYIYKRLIQSLMKNNQFTEALDVCHQSLIKSPQDLKILTLLARCYKKLKFYKEAKELYEKLVSKCPEDKFLYKEYIEVKSVDKPPEELVKELDSILKVSSVSGNVHLRLLLAGTLKGTGNFEEAIKHYRIALETMPGDIYILKQLGFCYMKMRNFTDAISVLRSVFLSDPGDYYVKTSLISACKKTGEIESFIKLIEETIKKHPSEKKLWGLKKKMIKLL